MATRQMNGVRRHLRRAALPPGGGRLTDGYLLERFLAAGDEAAFEALMHRHGPMVLGVCRRVLRQEQDAEDAFQATFLVLVRKGSSVVARESVGSWLYGVAYRTSLKAREATARRRAKEMQMAQPEALHEPDDPWSDLRPLLDQELNRLPDKYREPVVLCDLEGHTQKEAARRLGWPEGTVSGRLARARALLARRLARRGLALSGGVLALTLTRNAATAAVPAPLAGSTLQAAARIAAGNAAAGTVSAPVAALTEGVLQTMSTSQVKRVFAVMLAVGLMGAGWGVYQSRAGEGLAKKLGNKTSPLVAAPAPTARIKGGATINLPTGPAPTQVLASLDKDGKLVIKTATMMFRGGGFAVPPPAAPLPGIGGPGAGGGIGGPAPPAVPLPAVPPPGGGAGGGPAGPVPAAPPLQVAWELRSQTYNLDDVTVLDTKGRKLDKKTVVKLLKKETVALASMWGQPVDPLHLRVLKDGLLVFVLPLPKAIPAIPGIAPPGGVIPPLPALPAVPPGAGGGGIGGAAPGVTGPATVAPPVPPTGVKP
jgi:RNA polymerase sigma factor (sigma-70 family)